MPDSPTTTPATAEDEALWELIFELAELTGAAPLNARPGCWYIAIDNHWEFAINGHSEPNACTAFRNHHGSGIPVPPFHCYIEYNGWPAGMLSPRECVIAAGDIANLTTLCTAIRDHITGRGQQHPKEAHRAQ